MFGRIFHFLNSVDESVLFIVIFIVALGIVSTAIHFIGV